MSPIVVHHLERSRSQRLLWLLEELEVDYELKHYARTREGRAPEALRAVHPLGRSPVITHGDVLIAESGAIMEYLVETLGEGRMKPEPGTDELLRYRFFLHFAEGSMMPPLLVKLLFNRVRDAVPLLGRLIASKVDAAYTDPEIISHLAFVDAELSGRTWLAGESLTAADVMMSYPLQAALSRANLPGEYSHIANYIARCEARPAYARAVERGGPFEIPG